jgi:hypothetical protein
MFCCPIADVRDGWRNTLKEHMFSAVTPATDIAQQGQHVRSVPKPDLAVILSIESEEVRAIGLTLHPIDGDTPV